MARNGSGVYSPPAANYPAVSGTLITSADRNVIDEDIATALTNSIATNGESVITNDIPFWNNKLTGVAAGTAATDAATLSQVQSGGSSLLASVTGADTITATLSPSLTAYASGQLFKLIPASNNTGAVTLNINGLGAKAVTKNGTTALVADDLVAGVIYLLEYDGTRFQAVSLTTGYLPLSGGSLTGLLNVNDGADIASATTVNLTTATGNTVRITGTTAITAFTMNAGQQMELVAVGALPLTYHATTMNINGGASYTCAAGDRLRVFKDSSGIIYVNITKQSGDALLENYFYKSDIQAVAFTKTGAGTATIKAGTKVAVASTLQTFATDTSIVMPTLTAGTDYAIYVCTDGTVRADASFTAPSGYTVGNSRQVGGFHYAPGGNAAAQAGGNTTPAINEYSLWDIKFRPACTDPRGMALVAGHFWADIYLLGVDYLTNGSSKYNVSIADGSAPPKRSTLYGGNGTATYADGNWWNLNEALKHVGKRSPTYSEFAALAYGTTEATSSGGTDVPTTGVSGTGATSAWNLFTSKFGIIQASGCMWIWGDDFGGAYGTAAYTANTQGRGSTYTLSNAVLLGGNWAAAANSGSRASLWDGSPAGSATNIGARGVCDHLTLV